MHERGVGNRIAARINTVASGETSPYTHTGIGGRDEIEPIVRNSLTNSSHARAGFGERPVDLLERIAALRSRFGIGVRGEQFLGEPVAVGSRAEQLLPGLVALQDAVAQFRREPLQCLANLRGLRARLLRLFGGRGGAGFLLAQLAGEARDLGKGAVALRLEEIEVATQRANLGGARFQIGDETKAIGALIAGFVGRRPQGGEGGIEIGFQARVEFGRLGQVRGERAR